MICKYTTVTVHTITNCQGFHRDVPQHIDHMIQFVHSSNQDVHGAEPLVDTSTSDSTRQIKKPA